MLYLQRLFYLRKFLPVFLLLIAGCSEEFSTSHSSNTDTIGSDGIGSQTDVGPNGEVSFPDTSITPPEGEDVWDANPADNNDTQSDTNDNDPEICDNGFDDNDDGLIDCEDTDCAEADECVSENCVNGVDDDEDILTDCNDPDCAGDPACPEVLCTDGLDNDLDDLIDCADPDCDSAPHCDETLCDDGLDNEADGLVDCEDPDCVSFPACVESDCENEADDDGDGLVDCDDPDCPPTGPCGEKSCIDEFDDDGDGLTDCEDPDCAASSECVEEDCSNGIDDDGDETLDCADAECIADAGCGESNCIDGIDDDGDGFTDCADSECVDQEGCLETDCTNQLDDDGDGLPDCLDPDCQTVPECVPESCVDYYLCLGVEGCGCTLGVDCPPVDSSEFGACQGACFQDNACNQSCFDSLGTVFQNNLVDFMACTETFCLDVPDEETAACVFDNCLTQYAKCFYVGAQPCSYYALECEPGCGDDLNCQYDCLDALSSTGFEDAYLWDECRYSLCDADGDFEADSTACLSLAGYAACSNQAGTCIPVDTGLAGTACNQARDCFLSCHPFLDEGCMSACTEQMPTEVAPSISNLFTCVINTCGTTQAGLSIPCINNALQGPCANLNEACGP